MNEVGQIARAGEQQEEFWQLLADNMPQMAWVADKDGWIYWYNRRWYEYTGTTLSDMEGWGWKAVHHPDHVDAVVAKFSEAVKSGTVWEDLFPIRGSDGNFRWFLSRAQPIRDPAGEITHWFGTNTDVTDQLATEQALREASERINLALDAGAIIGTWFWDLQKDAFTIDEQFAVNFGLNPAYGREGIPLEKIIETVHPDDKPGLMAAIDEVVSRGGHYAHQYRVRRRDGNYYWIEANGRVDYDNDRPSRFPGVLIDVHDRKEAELELRRSEERYRALFNSMDEGFCLIELIYDTAGNAVDYRFVETNPAFAAQSGLPDAAGKSIREIAPDYKELWVGNYAQVAETGEPLRFVGYAGALRRWFDVFAFRFGDQSEHQVAVLFKDVSAEKEREASLRESEARARQAVKELEAVYAAAPIGLTVLDKDLRYVRINDRLAEINGIPASEHIGKTVRELVPGVADQAEAALRRVLEGHEVWGVEITGETPARPGALRTWRENWLPMRDSSGEIVGIAISAEEVTEAKQAQDRLRDAEERYRAVFEQAAVGVARVSVDGPFLEMNDRYAQILRRTREEALAADWREITHPDDLAADVANVEAMLRGEIDRYSMEKRYLAPDGTPIWVNLTIGCQRDDEGHVQFFIPVIEDINDRKVAEEALKQSEERYRALFESMEQGFCTIQVTFDGERAVDYRFTELNPAFTEHTGLQQEVLNRSVREAVPGLEDKWFERYGEIARTGVSQRFVDEAKAMGRWFDVYAFRIGAPEDHNVAILFTDITERVRQEQVIRESEARLRAVIDSMPVGLVFADADGRITGGNSRVQEIIGQGVVNSESTDDYAADYVAFRSDGRQVESDEYPLVRVIKGGEERPELECRVQRGDGSLVWVRYVAAPIRDPDGNLLGGVVASLDVDKEKRLTEGLEREVERVVAEREAAQEALRQSQKLEAMGQLTGGVAHDFNNLLTPIIGSLDLLHKKQVLDARTQRLVDGALQSAERAKILVQRLLAFARRQPLQPRAVDVGQIIGDMKDLVASTSGPRVKVEVSVPPGLPPALADGNQLEMALLNLSVNARDAMPDGGTLSIGARHEQAAADNRLGLKAGNHIVLAVADTGEGMDEETQRRAIEPFFSTKGLGKGTGLGLSMVHGLAAQLGGALKIRSAKGVGTAIELWLPVAESAAESATSAPADHALRGAGTALLVDDEELARGSTAAMLADLGYEVVEAGSGEEALALVGGGLRPRILVTDQLMPGLSGTELAVQLRQRLPDLPVLVASGYADLDSLTPSFPHLAKPFRQDELTEALRKLTEGGRRLAVDPQGGRRQAAVHG